MKKQDLKTALQGILPEGSVDIVLEWITTYKISLKISRERNTKLGDYRCPRSDQGHRISVNGNLNPYAFLVTFVHEIAHLVIWENFKNKARPHGKEWKQSYSELISVFISVGVFPEDVALALKNSIKKVKANSYGDINLSKVLKSYDTKQSGILVEDIPLNGVFRLQNGLTFRKIARNRIRYRCVCLENKRIYSVHPMANVTELLD